MFVSHICIHISIRLCAFGLQGHCPQAPKSLCSSCLIILSLFHFCPTALVHNSKDINTIWKCNTNRLSYSFEKDCIKLGWLGLHYSNCHHLEFSPIEIFKFTANLHTNRHFTLRNHVIVPNNKTPFTFQNKVKQLKFYIWPPMYSSINLASNLWIFVSWRIQNLGFTYRTSWLAEALHWSPLALPTIFRWHLF